MHLKECKSACTSDTCTSMFTVAQFTIAKLQNQARYYSAIKKNEIVLYAGKWMELETIILSEIIQTQKDIQRMFPLICEI
jgi:hypothetical protein